MSDVDDRWFKLVAGEKVKTTRHGTGKRYAARWRDDQGRQRSKSFDRKVDAQDHLAGVRTDLNRGAYIDPKAGKVKLRDYAARWLAAQTTDPSTREAAEHRLRNHVLPALGGHELRTLAPSTVQAWTRGLQGQLAANSVRVVFTLLSAVMQAAVDDGLIVKNPCRASSVRPPVADRRRVVPWTGERVAAVRDAMPARDREMVTAGAGLGLRQGEVFGLGVSDVDWLRGVVHVRRQVKIVGGQLVFAPPKGGKERDVPLPESVSLRLAAQLAGFPARKVTLPWRDPGAKPVAVELIFTTAAGQAYRRNRFAAAVWRPALGAAGVPAARDAGMHALRHYFASVVLDGGANIKALADWLGHADPGFTLRTYTHLMPAGETRMRQAIDAALTGGAPDVRQATQ